ncbi:MAG: DUF2805 domain-containing protein [Flavobacterium sp.]
MRKHRPKELTPEEIFKVVSIAQEERKPFEVLKLDFGLSENEVTELMRKRLSKDQFELWKKKVAAAKPKPKMNHRMFDDDDELDAKYYFKNKFD